MASDSEDADGEDLGLISPGLIRVLRNVLDEYPDDGQILKEMIQNAEDAGAQKVKILTDRRHFNRDVDNKTRRKHPHLAFLQGPSLCVYNDAEFTDSDWKGIRMLHASVKEKDPLKVGRFGLGFKSVFHLTDRLVIISGKHILYMDPFKGEENYCKRKRIAQLKGRELESVLRCTEGVFGVTRETFLADGGHFQGTIFWFPLRQNASDLSSIVYTDDHVHDLLNSFKAESRFILLFLKNIERVQVFSRKDTQDPEEHFTAELSASCLQTVRAERQKFIRVLQEAGAELPDHGVDCITEMTIDTTDHLAPSRDSQKWLVVNYHPGQGEVSSELAELCADPYRPYVGVAIPLDEQREFQSQIFCFLPLPLLSRSPTGLPVHVNGYFALSQNRRHLKWPTQDQVDNQAHLEAPVRWNCLMVKELVPRAYTRLLGRLKQLYLQNSHVFYGAWPDGSHVTERWRPLVEPLFRTMATESSFHTEARGGEWIPLSHVILHNFPPGTSPNVEAAVFKVYTENNENLVKLPPHVEDTLRRLGLLDRVTTISHQRTSQLLPACLHRLTHSEKLHVLYYLCCHDNAAVLLQNQELLPLADGTFGVLGSSVAYFCEGPLMRLFPGLEGRFCSCDSSLPSGLRDKLRMLAQSGCLSLRLLHENDAEVATLIQESMQTRYGHQQPSLSTSDPWIQQVWKFLSETDPWCRDLSRISHLNLLPCPTGNTLTLFPLNGLYVCSAARGLRSLDTHLAASLTKLLITVLPQMPAYVTHIGVLGALVQYPSPDGVLAVLTKLSCDYSLRNAAVRKFDDNASSEDVEALVTFLADTTAFLGGAVDLLRELNLFKLKGDTRFVSVNEVQEIGPDCSLPVEAPRSLLNCGVTPKRAALKLGAQEKTLKQVVRDILDSSGRYSTADMARFMKFFLIREDLMADASLMSVARRVKFLSTSSGKFTQAENLYDPSCTALVEMFYAEGDRFPCGEFASPDMLKRLKKLGLRTDRNIKPADLLQAATNTEQLWARGDVSTAERKAEALWRFLVTHGSTIQTDVLNTMSQIQCLPCLQPGAKPSYYPSSLPIKSNPRITKPAELCRMKHARLTGSTLPMARPDLAEPWASGLQVDSHLGLHLVLQHLRIVVDSFNAREMAQYRLILSEIFQFLNKNRSNWTVKQTLQEQNCVLVESGEEFVRCDKFWVQRKQGNDIDLKPYRFPLPGDMMEAKELFVQCGSAQRQDESMLQQVLEEIRSSHEDQTPSQEKFDRDLSLVKQILDKLKTCQFIPKGTVLLPIEHDQGRVLKFRPASECTISGQAGIFGAEEQDIFCVLQDIHSSTAKDLGALDIRQRALTGIEGLDYGYGQREELTTRLRTLLSDSYTDGFSVPKELIQNADDAGASEVRFLLDERENLDATSNLISDNMASLQGQAIWAFNDATFTDEDFANIVKLGAGTKKDDASKVGRFGLGFNSVYNLTDAPSFISRHTMTMFDPHVKYLPGGAGVKLDFTRSVNRHLLSRMPNQFMPFQGVFGCELKKEKDVMYKGTLFRFPLRTDKQAQESKIKGESYSQSKRREFLKMLLDRAGSLLMFTQNVKKVQVYHLPSNCTDPRDARCLLTVTRSSLHTDLLSGTGPLRDSVLKHCTAFWSNNRDIKILEQVRIEVDVTNEAKAVCDVNSTHVQTDWKLAWATGTGYSAKVAKRYGKKGFVPLATVAVPLTDNGIQTLSDSPFGFYASGHLFCFMPLPKEMVEMHLQVHINGTFDLTSSRRSLQVHTEDDMGPGLDWNSALFGDAVCRAYLLLLENLHGEAATDTDFRRYFDLWPDTGKESIDNVFYKRLVSDNNIVFPVPGQNTWVAFQDAWFLDTDFRESDCGQLAWDALNHFLDREGGLVDIPSHICRLIQSKGQKDAFRTRVITKQQFYEHFFFPHIDSDYWKPAGRDILVHHALMMQNDQTIQDLVRNYACIPCEDTGKLEYPKHLIHPSKQASKLYRSSDGRFPQGSSSLQHGNEMNFCSFDCLTRLEKLGMIVDDMSLEMIVERAESVNTLMAEDRDGALKRARNLIDYLASPRGFTFRFDSFSATQRQALSRIKWLPVLRKPEDWPFLWKGDEGPALVAPEELFSESLRDLVACKAKLLDSKAMEGAGSLFYGKKKDVFEALGVKTAEDYKDSRLLQLAIDQLLTVAHHHERDPSTSTEKIRKLCEAACGYLNKCIIRSEKDGVAEVISNRVSAEKVIWTGDKFVSSSQVAFQNPTDCRPYLFQLESGFRSYKPLFQAVGVKEKFCRKDASSVLTEIKQANVDGQLDKDTIKLVSRVAQLLCDAMKSAGEEGIPDGETFYLPDSQGRMLSTEHLCLDDCPWLQESETMRFVHESISPEVARALGVETKRGKDFDELMSPIPFGQHEKLTTRIKGLLEGYTFDSSLFKELLQNADDAGATEIKLILDMRDLGTEKVPAGWSDQLQGPALCVYNNKSFTTKDMQGIQNLGEGSKGDDLLKTGQYGVGFNAVYHITDVPSFWTRENDVQEVICVFDPNCRYVRNTLPNQPGVRLGNVSRIRQVYPDMFACYLGDTIENSKPGTLFRFPLRTEAMADVSALKQPAVTGDKMKKVLQDFRGEAKGCLLFLNNLQKIGIYHVNDSGDLELEYEAEKSVQESSTKLHQQFKTKLFGASMIIEDPNKGLLDVPEFETVVKMTLSDSVAEEQWVTVNRVGFSDKDNVSDKLLNEWKQKNFRLLPRGGVAVMLSQKKKEHQAAIRPEHYRAFCILPLPVSTGLHMHVNGHFVLDHEYRRNLWVNPGDVKTEWNTAIAQQVVVPAAVTAVQEVKCAWFPTVTEAAEAKKSIERLPSYHELFPALEGAQSPFWKSLMEGFYKKIAHDEIPVFPVICTDHSGINWAPAVNRSGFPGYFSNLFSFFKSSTDKPRASRPVQLTHGAVSQSSSSSSVDTWPLTMAEGLMDLLKALNMDVLHTPFRVYDAFKKSGVDSVQEVTPSTVITFLKSAGSGRSDACSIVDLPQPVASTPLQTVSNVESLIKYIKHDPEFLDKLEGLPLSLRQSEELFFFMRMEDEEKPIVSPFCRLLPGSASAFLNLAIHNYFSLSEKTETMLREFDISLLGLMLPNSLKEAEFKTGEMCPYDPSRLPESNWIKDVWKFIQTRLEKQKTDNSDIVQTRKKMEDELNCLAEWSFIPVKMAEERKDGKDRKEGKERELLYPVKHMHRVLYLSDKPDTANQKLWEILKELPLAFLHVRQLPAGSVLSRLVASISHPLALLHALTSSKTALTSSKRYAHEILSYFNANLKVLRDSSTDEEDLIRELCSLTLFQSLDDSLVPAVENIPTFCLLATVPKDGLTDWSRTQNVLLLRKKGVPDDLRDFLRFKKMPDEDFYSKHLLPTLYALPYEAIVKQMTAVRDVWWKLPKQEKDKMTRQLKATAFIVKNDQLLRAEDFYTPFETVFKAMCPPESFPPKPYCEWEWKEFMISAGMVSVVTDDMFVEFARILEKEGGSGLPEEEEESDAIKTKSDTLVCHLFLRDKVLEGSLMNRVQTIAFVRPSEWSARHDVKVLSKIAQPFSENRLVNFADSCREENLYLVWSSSSILCPTADPTGLLRPFSGKRRKAVLRNFPFLGETPRRKVFLHFTNVCRSLAEPDGQNLFKLMKDQEVYTLECVMDALYDYFSRNVEKWELAELDSLPVICDLKNRVMLKPETVILELREEEAIPGRIQKAPVQFGRYFDLFQKFGVAKRVTANHYAKVLSSLKTEAGGKSLHVEEMKIVKLAVEGVFRCLKSTNDEEKNLSVGELCLPSESKHLELSTTLTFKDSVLFGERLKEPPPDMHFFSGFERLKINVQMPLEEVNLLPQRYRMKLLSDIVREVLTERSKNTAYEGNHARHVTDRLQQPKCIEAVVRIAYHHYRRSASNEKFTEETAQGVTQTFQAISIKETRHLQTVLEVNGKLVHGSECEKLSFVDNISSDGRSSTVYLDSEACKDMTGNLYAFVRSFAVALRFMLKLELDSYLLQQVLMHPAQAQRILDAESVVRCDFKDAVERSVFPRAGTFVPVDLHCYLDNKFCEFYKGEHVGFETFDPAVSDPDRPDEDPVYIFAIVIGEVKQEGQDEVPLLARRYRIDLGPERGEAAVSVTQLYKFVRKARKGSSKALVKHDGSTNAEAEETLPTDLAAVLRKIRITFTDAWRLLDDAGQRRVVKRLYLKWHPDKNPGREEFCTRVVQAIQRYVDLLKQGKTLPEDEDEECGGSYRSSSSYSSFFDRMHRRGRRYRDHFNAGGGFRHRRGGQGGEYGSNPQPGEGRRWFEQAQADLAAAQGARGTCDKGQNWICYICHQAVEKALKAVLYARDAGSYLQSHDLNSLAQLVGDPNISQLARRLEARVGNHMRMRYPGVLTNFRIPGDVFSIDDANFACDVTVRLLAEVQSLLQTLCTLADGSLGGVSAEQPAFSKRWQFSKTFSASGGQLEGENSDVLLNVPEAAVEAGTVVIKGAVSTDLDRVHKELGLRDAERIVSPVVEYFAGHDFVFQRPVKISIPHFVPENSAHDSMSVYWFRKEVSGFRIQKLKLECGVDNKDQGDRSKGTFRLSGKGRIEVLVNHFCGFFCTHCGESSLQLQLRLYRSLCGENLTEVNVFLLVWDHRLNIKDFRENIVPKHEEDEKYVHSQSLDAPEDTTGINLAVCLALDNQQKDVWMHKLREHGKPVYPAKQKIDLQRYHPSCSKCSAKRVSWLLHSKPNKKPGAVFQCLIDVGYIAAEDQDFQLLDSHENQTLYVSHLELPPQRARPLCEEEAERHKTTTGGLGRHSPSLPSVNGRGRSQHSEFFYALPPPMPQVNGNGRRPRNDQNTHVKQVLAENGEGADSSQQQVRSMTSPLVYSHGALYSSVDPMPECMSNGNIENGFHSSTPESEQEFGVPTRVIRSTQSDGSLMGGRQSAAFPVVAQGQATSGGGSSATRQGAVGAYTFVHHPVFVHNFNIGKVCGKKIEIASQPHMPANVPSSGGQNDESTVGMAELQGSSMGDEHHSFLGATGSPDHQNEILQNAMLFNPDHAVQFQNGDCFEQMAAEPQGAAGGYPISVPDEFDIYITPDSLSNLGS